MVATEVFSGDDHYYGLCALFTVVMQLTFFFVAYACKFDLVTDFAGSTNFIALAWLSISLAGQFNTRQVYKHKRSNIFCKYSLF